MSRFALVVSVVLLLASMGSPDVTKRRHLAKGRPVRVLKGELGSVRQRRHEIRAKLHQTREQAQAVKRIIVVVDDRLDDVQTKLADTQRDLGAARRKQQSAATRLDETTKALDQARERARARLRAIAKQGDANVLVAFADAKSVGELAERKDLMERIARKDHEIFDRVKTLRRAVSASKVEKDEAVLRVAALARREQVQQADLKGVRLEKSAVLRGLRRQEADYEGALKQFDEDEREIRRLIALANVPRRRPGHPPLPAFIGRFLKPVAAPITSGFGMRYHPILHITRLHAGIDFGAPIGTPVRCAGPGEVVAATRMRGFGNVVIVDHGGGVSTVYGHLSRISVSTGQRIGQGQILGAVGTTGLSTGPHLHWEVHVGGRAVDPMGRF